MSLRELYQEMIIDHGKQPRNFGVLETATHMKHGHNPLCGDKLVVYLTEQDGLVTDVRFEGTGCAISMASASIMTEVIKGKAVAVVEQMFADFHHLITTGEAGENDLGKLAVFAGVYEFPARVKCATLAWHTMNAAIHFDDQPVSTE